MSLSDGRTFERIALIILTLAACARSDGSDATASDKQLEGAKAALEAAHVADSTARRKQLAECSAKLMIWPKTGYIYETCPDDRRPAFIDDWRPARPSELEAYKAAGAKPVQDWDGRTASAEETTVADESTRPLFYTTLMNQFGEKEEIWGIFQSTDRLSSQKRCNHSRELLLKDSEQFPLKMRPTFYCLPTATDVTK
jgi:hypothetical protein